jgi:quinol monooxygenase YgiN
MFSGGSKMLNRYRCTEIVEFQAAAEITDEDFIKIVEELEENFHSRQKGFIDTELVKDNEPHQWVMIQHWESVEKSKEASKIMMKTPSTEAFRRALDVKTIKIRYLTHVKKWSYS